MLTSSKTAPRPRSVYWHVRPVLDACAECDYPRDLHAADCPRVKSPPNRSRQQDGRRSVVVPAMFHLSFIFSPAGTLFLLGFAGY
jgi:hypothetical protein